MKKTITYILILLVSFAYNYETIEYFSRTVGVDQHACTDDFDCDENGSESENSKEKEKNEKLNLYDDLISCGDLVTDLSKMISIESQQNPNFSSSDYSQVIYSPPEKA